MGNKNEQGKRKTMVKPYVCQRRLRSSPKSLERLLVSLAQFLTLASSPSKHTQEQSIRRYAAESLAPRMHPLHMTTPSGVPPPGPAARTSAREQADDRAGIAFCAHGALVHCLLGAVPAGTWSMRSLEPECGAVMFHGAALTSGSMWEDVREPGCVPPGLQS
jgi:hypothetical protein